MIGVCVREREKERERERVHVRVRGNERFNSPYTFVVSLFGRKRRNSPNLWAKCVVRTLSQIQHLMEETDLRSAGFESKYLLKLKRNSKQGYGCTRNETKAGVGLKLCK